MLGAQFTNPAFSYQKRRQMIQRLLGQLHTQGQQANAVGGVRGGVSAGGLSKMNQRPSLMPKITNPHAQGISKILANALGPGGVGIPSPLEYSQDYGVGAEDNSGIDYGSWDDSNAIGVDDNVATPDTQNNPYGYGGADGLGTPQQPQNADQGFFNVGGIQYGSAFGDVSRPFDPTAAPPQYNPPPPQQQGYAPQPTLSEIMKRYGAF